jgi:hypothetical protein
VPMSSRSTWSGKKGPRVPRVGETNCRAPDFSRYSPATPSSFS